MLCTKYCKKTFALSSILGYQNGMSLAILNLQVAPMPPIKFQLNPTYKFGRRFCFEEFQDGHYGGHIGYQKATVLAILKLHVTLMPPIKFLLKSDTGFGRRCDLRNFEMATIAAILDIGTKGF